MSNYTLELGETIYRLKCGCCGKMKKRIFGFVSKDGDAHAVYYALLNITEDQPRIGLTLSVGPWWHDTNQSDRKWIHVEVTERGENIEMGLREPQQSNFYPWERGGVPLTSDEARKSETIKDFWAAADFIVDADPAISSYLDGKEPDPQGREERDADGSACRC